MKARLIPLLALAVGAGKCTPEKEGPHEPVAAARNDIQSCYAAVLQTAAPPPSRSLFVLVDQTTGLSDRLRGTVTANVARVLEPGTRFSIATFSANTGADFATVLTEGTIEGTIPHSDKGAYNPKKFAALEQCLSQQRAYAVQIATTRLGEATTASATTFTNSEILSSLTQLSHAVAAAPGSEKLVILVSDLIEHSGETSFYAARGLRTIDPEAELAKADAAHQVGTFGGARVAVVGAGLISPTPGASPKPRSAAAMSALRTFWERWFERSGGRIVEYGEPDLITALSWSSATGSSPGN